MSILFIASNTILLVCALLLAGRSYQVFEKHVHKASMVISLSATFIACSTLGTLLIHQQTSDLITLKRILDNLAFYAGIPLLASAFVDMAWKHDWSKPTWGRWLLVLFALFELARRAEFGAQYSQIMATLSILALLISFIKKANSTAILLGTLASTFLAASLLIFSPTSIIPALENSHYAALSLAAALIFLTKILPKNP
ncbi:MULTISPECIES: hypothetical protein [unclassified Neptuniibacter]|uniref:hypothetical protein n=1 Tax=unclassified Neptuniibacter TaxID=2630693 RepID=UPI000C64DC49|nr:MULTISPECIES: hypothetical protein [unclassified Neptuniibacter]MAY43594.1 hypothetical protein [Oceanospirillaceae bacterium]|tara:strand:- start:11897 stop:12493 length:597 start_codon:yes stop_codon:yes gene_type:complete